MKNWLLAKQERIKQALERYHALRKERWLAEYPSVEPMRVKQLLARYLDFSETEQDQYLWRFPEALSGRDRESRPAPQRQWSDQSDMFDPFLNPDDLP